MESSFLLTKVSYWCNFFRTLHSIYDIFLRKGDDIAIALGDFTVSFSSDLHESHFRRNPQQNTTIRVRSSIDFIDLSFSNLKVCQIYPTSTNLIISHFFSSKCNFTTRIAKNSWEIAQCYFPCARRTAKEWAPGRLTEGLASTPGVSATLWKKWGGQDWYWYLSEAHEEMKKGQCWIW